ncbi:unnamed protein product [Lactuca virosa]|uniref:Uncharacterized protein n=1 Tax=Lactuca virosa TaxID=75947 RepID=A0AAU9PKA9_9ASTR|nr:unnamed protein product [Lactuca virosa]
MEVIASRTGHNYNLASRKAQQAGTEWLEKLPMADGLKKSYLAYGSLGIWLLLLLIFFKLHLGLKQILYC